MTHIFSNVDLLLASFRSPSTGREARPLLDCSEMEECIHILRSIEGSPQRIFPSLWVALGKIYAPNRRQKTIKTPYYEGNQPSAWFQDRCEEIDHQRAADIIAVAVAALNSSVPASGIVRDDFNLFRYCSQLGFSMIHQTYLHYQHPRGNESFIHLHDAFSDENAIDLATRMVRVWMTYRTREAYDASLGSFASAVVNRLEPSSKTQEGNDEVQGEVKIAPSFLLTEWLRRVIFRHWDGRAEIDLMSTVAGAIDWLGILGT